ncbi:hypothetical protein [uncultured Victivallis sp.]|uniref:hypothetical protein n=1 Tax=uncultured Victivallis sp. TaxID=354118 RepID=UPI0025932AF7|nr:hypothetical protein [uncultured Victivallis sp.]
MAQKMQTEEISLLTSLSLKSWHKPALKNRHEVGGELSLYDKEKTPLRQAPEKAKNISFVNKK